MRWNKAAELIHFEYQANQSSVVLPTKEKAVLAFDECSTLKSLSFLNDNITYQFNAKNQIEKLIYQDKTTENFEYHPLTGLLMKHTRRDGKNRSIRVFK